MLRDVGASAPKQKKRPAGRFFGGCGWSELARRCSRGSGASREGLGEISFGSEPKGSRLAPLLQVALKVHPLLARSTCRAGARWVLQRRVAHPLDLQVVVVGEVHHELVGQRFDVVEAGVDEDEITQIEVDFNRDG